MCKKMILSCVILLVFLLVGCEAQGDALGDIRECDLTLSSGWIRCRNPIDAQPIRTKDEGRPQERTLVIDGKTELLVYAYTQYYPAGEYYLDIYKVVETRPAYTGERKLTAGLYRDGTVGRLSGEDFGYIDVQPGDTTEEIRKKAEAAMGEIVDFSQYDGCQAEEGNGIRFTYRKWVGEYSDAMCSFTVSPTGQLQELTVLRSVAAEAMAVSKAKEAKVLQEKAAELTGEAQAQYTVVGVPQYIQLQKEVYLRYSVEILVPGKDTNGRAVLDLLVPVRLLQ